MTDDKLFTVDCRTGDPICSKEDGLAIMDPKQVMEVKTFTHRNPDGVVVSVDKPVYYYKSLGWILKANKKEGDTTREEFLKELGKQPFYEDITNVEHIARLEEDFKKEGKRRAIYVE